MNTDRLTGTLGLTQTAAAGSSSTSKGDKSIPIATNGLSLPLLDSGSIISEFQTSSAVLGSKDDLVLPDTQTERLQFLLLHGHNIDFGDSLQTSTTARKLQESTLYSIGFMQSTEFPNVADSEVYTKRVKRNTDEQRNFNLAITNNDYKKYLEHFRQNLKLASQELFLQRAAAKLLIGEEEKSSGTLKELTSIVTSENNVSTDQELSINCAKEILVLAAQNSDILIYIFDQKELCKILTSAVEDGPTKKLLALVRKNPTRFINADNTIRQLCLVDSISKKSESISGSPAPNVLSKHLDKLNKGLEAGENIGSSQFNSLTEKHLDEAINETIRDFNNAYNAEMQEVEKSLDIVIPSGHEGLGTQTSKSGVSISRRAWMGGATVAVLGALGLEGYARVTSSLWHASQPTENGGNGNGTVNGNNEVKAVETNNGGDKGKTELVNSILALNEETRKFEREINNYPESRDFLGAAQKALSQAKLDSKIVLGKWNNSEDPKELTEGLNALSTDQLDKLKEAFEEFSKAEYTVKIITILEQESNFSKEYMEKATALEKKHKMNGLSTDNDKKMFLSGYEANALKAFYAERVAIFQPEADFQTLDENQKTMVTELLKLKEEFPTYKEAEDKDQVTAVYKKHNIAPATITREDLVKLAKATPEALADVYVESLDASCRVVAKGELAELKKQYPVEGFDLTKPEEREKLKTNLNNVYFRLLYFYLAKFPSEEYLKKNFGKVLEHLDKFSKNITNDAYFKPDWDNFCNMTKDYSMNKVKLEDLLAAGSKLPVHVTFEIPILNELLFKYKLENHIALDLTGIPVESFNKLAQEQLKSIFSEKEVYELFNDSAFSISSLVGTHSFGPNFWQSYCAVALSSFKHSDKFISDEPAFANQEFQKQIFDQYQTLEDRIKDYKKVISNSQNNLSSKKSELQAIERCLIRLKDIKLLLEKKYKEINQ